MARYAPLIRYLNRAHQKRLDQIERLRQKRLVKAAKKAAKKLRRETTCACCGRLALVKRDDPTPAAYRCAMCRAGRCRASACGSMAPRAVTARVRDAHGRFQRPRRTPVL